MKTAENGGLLSHLLIFSKLSIFPRRHIDFKFSCIVSPESPTSFTFPLAKETGGNRYSHLFLQGSAQVDYEPTAGHHPCMKRQRP
jgi:hypothetical protein